MGIASCPCRLCRDAKRELPETVLIQLASVNYLKHAQLSAKSQMDQYHGMAFSSSRMIAAACGKSHRFRYAPPAIRPCNVDSGNQVALLRAIQPP